MAVAERLQDYLRDRAGEDGIAMSEIPGTEDKIGPVGGPSLGRAADVGASATRAPQRSTPAGARPCLDEWVQKIHSVFIDGVPALYKEWDELRRRAEAAETLASSRLAEIERLRAEMTGLTQMRADVNALAEDMASRLCRLAERVEGAVGLERKSGSDVVRLRSHNPGRPTDH